MAKTAALAIPVNSDFTDVGRERWIDLVFLGRQTMGNKSLELEILKLFKSQLEIHLPQLAQLEDQTQLRVRLHTIKGAARGVGAVEVGQLAANAEDDLLNNGQVQPDALDGLQHAVQQTCNFISDLLETK